MVQTAIEIIHYTVLPTMQYETSHPSACKRDEALTAQTLSSIQRLSYLQQRTLTGQFSAKTPRHRPVLKKLPITLPSLTKISEISPFANCSITL